MIRRWPHQITTYSLLAELTTTNATFYDVLHTQYNGHEFHLPTLLLILPLVILPTFMILPRIPTFSSFPFSLTTQMQPRSYMSVDTHNRISPRFFKQGCRRSTSFNQSSSSSLALSLLSDDKNEKPKYFNREDFPNDNGNMHYEDEDEEDGFM